MSTTPSAWQANYHMLLLHSRQQRVLLVREQNRWRLPFFRQKGRAIWTIWKRPYIMANVEGPAKSEMRGGATYWLRVLLKFLVTTESFATQP